MPSISLFLDEMQTRTCARGLHLATWLAHARSDRRLACVVPSERQAARLSLRAKANRSSTTPLVQERVLDRLPAMWTFQGELRQQQSLQRPADGRQRLPRQRRPRL